MRQAPPLFALIACAALLPVSSQAAPLKLAQSPATLGREPAPNVIVSVDDSGSMGFEGIATLQATLRKTFSAANVPDDRVRLAWQSMNRCAGIPSNSVACKGQNGMARLNGPHRTNFLNWVDRLTANNQTPSHLMIDEAGKYLSRTDLGVHSPWASDPGVTENPVLSCRKSYHIFMTDGAWNTVPYSGKDAAGLDNEYIARGGNADNTTFTLPDGVKYDTASAQTRLYRDDWGNATVSTLSDLAFYYWSRDLQPGLANNVRPSPKTQWPRQDFGKPQLPAELDAYWNPRNDPATWQHLVTYTIGFNDAAAWTGLPAWSGDTFNNLGGLINGDVRWPSPLCSYFTDGNSPCDSARGLKWTTRENERKVELWHAALNSRGRFVPAHSSTALLNAFQGILDDILSQTAQPLVSIASSSNRLRSDGLIYVAGFDSSNWSGSLKAYVINATTQAISSTPTWSAQQLLDASTPEARQILTHNGIGISFQWDNLSEGQQAALKDGGGDTEGRRRLNYLRGYRGDENDKIGGTLRRRDSRLGDIANANIWQTRQPVRLAFEHPGHADFRRRQAGRKPMLYVGANDGMLHAFGADDGQELMAYVPAGVYSRLAGYTRPDYSHRYFVDGQAFTGDADVSGSANNAGLKPDWHTFLVGALGGGGRGYFVLDVTTPLPASAPTSTFKPSGVLLDRSFPGTGPAPDEAGKDIGHIYAQPVVSAVDGSRSEQIVKLNNGRWAVVMGNGINSVNERPVLLIQYLDGARELLRIVAQAATDQANGLSAPRLLDMNGDGTMDVAYAGDLQGHLWKFNLTHTDATKWGVSDWNGGGTPCKDTSCTPFFSARDAAIPAKPQAIVTAPLWMAHPLGGVQILFGTGRDLEEADRANASVQTIYSVWDRSRYAVLETGEMSETADARGSIPGRTALVQQSVTGAVTSRAPGTEVPTQYFNTTRNPVAYSRTDASAPCGWYMDLPDPGERVLSNAQLFEGQKVIVATAAPPQGSAEETCAFEQAQESGAITVLNMITGQPAKTPVFATTDATMSLTNASRVRFGNGESTLIYAPGGGLNLLSLSNASGDPACGPGKPACIKTQTLAAGKVPGRRADWRVIE